MCLEVQAWSINTQGRYFSIKESTGKNLFWNKTMSLYSDYGKIYMLSLSSMYHGSCRPNLNLTRVGWRVDHVRSCSVCVNEAWTWAARRMGRRCYKSWRPLDIWRQLHSAMSQRIHSFVPFPSWTQLGKRDDPLLWPDIVSTLLHCSTFKRHGAYIPFWYKGAALVGGPFLWVGKFSSK